jgi:phosphatidylinositol alpha-1,6-mannosyltransferase
MLLVVGDAPIQALHAATQTHESIQAAAQAMGVAGNIRFLGKVSDEELFALYRAADVHVFPVREIPGDPEGFGMVAVEAAAYGVPTVAFATGGVADAVADGQSGRLIPTGDYAAFAEAVAMTLTQRGTMCESCIGFAGRFAWPKFGMGVAEQLVSIEKLQRVSDSPS